MTRRRSRPPPAKTAKTAKPTPAPTTAAIVRRRVALGALGAGAIAAGIACGGETTDNGKTPQNGPAPQAYACLDRFGRPSNNLVDCPTPPQVAPQPPQVAPQVPPPFDSGDFDAGDAGDDAVADAQDEG